MKASSLFAKRKPQKAKNLERKGVGTTPTVRKLLIVCEGTKTEPHYFEALRAAYRDQLKGVEIRPSKGSAPISIVEHAEKLYTENLMKVGHRSLAFEAVYCVFDQDNASTFDKAMVKIGTLKAGKAKMPIHAIASYPCFEFWLILHFEFTRSPFAKTSENSVGDMVKKKLREFPGFKDYEEREPNAYALTKDRLRDCIKHSKWAAREARADNEPNPSTHMHELVECLLSIVRNSLLAAWKKLKLNGAPNDTALAEINAIESILSIAKTT